MSNKTNQEKEVLLSVRGVDVAFDHEGKRFRAVKNANFDIYRGETFSLVGESGSGKTTIGRAIMRINSLSTGEIYFKGKKISGKISKELDREVIRSIQMIFQDPAASLNERAPKVEKPEIIQDLHEKIKKMTSKGGAFYVE